MNLDIKIEEQGQHTIVYLSGEVDVYTAPKLKEKLFPLAEQENQTIVIDLAQVEFMDSTGLGTIIGALKKANSNHSKLILQHANERLQRLFSITGLSEIVEVRRIGEGQA